MRKLVARLNRAHQRAALQHELHAMRVWNSPLADERAATIARQLADLEAQDRANPSTWPRVAAPMPLLQRAVPAYPENSSPFLSAARQVVILLAIALAVTGALWN